MQPLTRVPFLAGERGGEDLVERGGVDATPGVAHLDHYASIPRPVDAEGDPSLGQALGLQGLEGVHDDVDEHALEAVRLRTDERGPFEVTLNLDPAGSRQRGRRDLQGALHDIGELDLLLHRRPYGVLLLAADHVNDLAQPLIEGLQLDDAAGAEVPHGVRHRDDEGEEELAVVVLRDIRGEVIRVLLKLSGEAVHVVDIDRLDVP